MAHFIQGRLLLLDLETDSKESEDAHLIEAALIGVTPAVPPEGRPARRERVWLARPTRRIPDEAVGVHGITNERATAEGRPRSDVLIEIMAGLRSWSDDCPLIGHNISYDLTVLDRNLYRELGTELIIAGPVIDTFLIDRCCDQWRPGSRQLTDVAAHYRIKLGDAAHNAGADALAAGQIAWRMAMNRNWPYGRYGPSTLEREARMMVSAGDAPSLHSAQQRWFTTRQLELAEYFRTPKAVEAIYRKVAEGRLTAEQGEVAIAALPEAAVAAEASAHGGWPIRSRIPATT